jgi:tRNA pseudouridine55 synthase
VKTATGDREGEVIATRAVPTISPGQLAEVQSRFSGPLLQVPPMHSALKRDGKALYEYARAGLEVEREARHVTVFALQLALVGPALVRIVAKVSKGTYIRTLGEDIGEALGCGAHLVSLRRIATGPFGVSECVSLEELAALDETEREARLLPVESLLPGHTRIALGTEDAGRFLSGLRRRGAWADAEHAAVFGEAPPALLGTAHVKAGELIPSRLLSPIEIKQILGAAEPENV